MAFGRFAEVYREDIRPQIKITTYETKFYIARIPILLCFFEKYLPEIGAVPRTF